MGFDRMIQQAVVHTALSSATQVDSGGLLVFMLQEDESHAAYFLRRQGVDRLTLLKVGISRANDGKEDAWVYTGPDGAIARIDVSTKRDGKVTRAEHYEKDALVSAEEDSDGDGKADKWETYDAGRLTSVAFDTIHRGTPDRRLIYGADGSTRLEVDVAGDGHFVAVKGPAAPATR